MSRVFFSTTTRTISDCGTFLDILISRVAAIAIPILFEQPVPSINNGQFDFDGVTAIGDIGFDLAYGVNETSGVLWALGMVGSLPTATDSDVASKQLRLGPDGLIAKFEKWGLYGIFPSHLWNVAGSDDSYYCNTQIQLVFKVLPGNAWTIGTSPISNYDWKSHEWTIPLNLLSAKRSSLEQRRSDWSLRSIIISNSPMHSGRNGCFL